MFYEKITSLRPHFSMSFWIKSLQLGHGSESLVRVLGVERHTKSVEPRSFSRLPSCFTTARSAWRLHRWGKNLEKPLFAIAMTLCLFMMAAKCTCWVNWRLEDTLSKVLSTRDSRNFFDTIVRTCKNFVARSASRRPIQRDVHVCQRDVAV